MKKIRCPTHPQAVDFELEATKSNANTRSPETAKLAIIRERGSISPIGLAGAHTYRVDVGGEEQRAQACKQHIQSVIGAEHTPHSFVIENRGARYIPDRKTH